LLLSEGEIIPGLNFTIRANAAKSLQRKYQSIRTPNTTIPYHPHRRFVIELTQTDFTRWKLASDFTASVRGIADYIVFDNENWRRNYVLTEIPNHTIHRRYLFGPDSMQLEILALTTASAAYGGLHLSAWNLYFPTMAERWLWMSSSICIAFAGCIPATLNLILNGKDHFLGFIKKQYPKGYKWFETMLKRLSSLRYSSGWGSWLNTFVEYTGMGALGVGCLIYCFARSFIVVEAFVSLRRLTIDFYDTPLWSNLIPHL
jgi:hypothetical protein